MYCVLVSRTMLVPQVTATRAAVAPGRRPPTRKPVCSTAHVLLLAGCQTDHAGDVIFGLNL
jgi:hypothetical protein